MIPARPSPLRPSATPPAAAAGRRRLGLAALALALSGAARAQPAASSCPLCKSELGSVDALRARLPASWQLALEPEPELGGEMLVVRAGPRDAPPLLLVHGLGQNGFATWLSTMQALAPARRLLAVDLPGFGYSSTPAAKLSPTHLARVLARLVTREPLAPVVVAGHSLGGAVALRLAQALPRQVSSLVLVSVAGVLHRTAFSKHLLSVPLAVQGMPAPLKEPVARLRDLGHQIVERVFGLPNDPTDLLRANEWLWPLALRERSHVNAALALVDEDFSALLHELPQPVQLIWGDADPIAPLRTGELLARRLPRARLERIAGVGHEPMADAPGAFQTLFEQALAAPPPVRAASSADAPRGGAASAGAAGASPGSADLHLRDEVDRIYGGRWREVRIERCSALRLVDLVAERIVVRDSIVQMTGVRVRGDGVALDVANSEIVATACDLTARVAIRTDASRVDLAGVHLDAREAAVRALARSRLVVSVSRLRDPRHAQWWHEDREIEQQTLDTRQPARPAATGGPGR